MKTVLEEFKEYYPDAPRNEYGLPDGVCPDDLGYIGLCEEGFDTTVQLCQECWTQTHEKKEPDPELSRKIEDYIEKSSKELRERPRELCPMLGVTLRERKSEMELLAVPGPTLVIQGEENIEKFLAISPVIETEDTRKRRSEFNKICKVENEVSIKRAENFRKSLKVVGALPMRNYCLWIKFNTEEYKIFDFKPFLNEPAFIPLKDLSVFKNIRLNDGVPTWCDGEIDISPDILYKQGVLD